MITKYIDNITSDIVVLKKMSDILMNNWQDRNAMTFQGSIIQKILDYYGNYQTDAESFIDELKRNMEAIEENMYEIEHTFSELNDICMEPSIQGCGIVRVRGVELNDVVCTRFFVLTREEMKYVNHNEHLERLAYDRCPELRTIEDVWFYTPIL